MNFYPIGLSESTYLYDFMKIDQHRSLDVNKITKLIFGTHFILYPEAQLFYHSLCKNVDQDFSFNPELVKLINYFKNNFFSKFSKESLESLEYKTFILGKPTSYIQQPCFDQQAFHRWKKAYTGQFKIDIDKAIEAQDAAAFIETMKRVRTAQVTIK